MAWVAVRPRDRRSVERLRARRGPVERWRALRDEIHDEVCREASIRTRNTFTQYYGATRARREPAHDAARRLPARRRPAHARHRRGDRARAAARRLRACAIRRPSPSASTGCRPARACSSPARSGSPTTTRCRAATTRRASCSSGCSRCATTVGLLSEEYDPRAAPARKLPAGVLARRAGQHRQEPLARGRPLGRSAGACEEIADDGLFYPF